MKWILDGLWRRSAAGAEQYASGHEPITPAEVRQTESVPHSTARASSSHPTEIPFVSKPKDLGLEGALKDIPGVTDQMVAAFGEHGITSIEDLAGCATDDLDGWSESKDGKIIRHQGILDNLGVPRQDCEAIIMNARIKAGWIT
jgi:predicted flap endonuclease-1-like 5' DNA nuclease